MNKTDQRLDQLAASTRLARPADPDAAPRGFATRVLALTREGERESSALWARLSLGSLPFAALLASGCLWWSVSSVAMDPSDLALVFVQTHFLP